MRPAIRPTSRTRPEFAEAERLAREGGEGLWGLEGASPDTGHLSCRDGGRKLRSFIPDRLHPAPPA